MQQILNQFVIRVIRNSISLETSMPFLGPNAVKILRIWRTFLELAYLLQFQDFSYLYIAATIGRPQSIEWFPNIDYVTCGICLLYLINIFWLFQWRKYITFIIIILNTNMLNFFFEQSKGNAQYPAQISLMVIYLWNTLIVSGKLDIETRNLEITKNNFLNIFTSILNIILMVCQIYIVDKMTIMSFAAISAIFQIVHHLYFNPYKDRITQIIIASIYLITVYLSILYIFELNTSFTIELIIFPFFTRLVYTQIKINSRQQYDNFDQILLNFDEKFLKAESLKSIQAISNADRIIYGSMMMKESKFFQALLFLENIKTEQLVTQIKLDFLQQKCLQLIETKVQQNSISQNQMYIAVKFLMESENKHFQVIQDIINIVKDKIYSYQVMFENKSSNYNYILSYTNKLLKLKDKLEYNYDQYPCDKTQNVLGFLYAEIMNDFFAANKLFNIMAISDDKMKRKGIISEIFSNKMMYLITNYKSNGLFIKRFSNNAPKIIGLSSDQLVNKNIDFLIPRGVAKWHDKLVASFMEIGDSKFLRKLGENYFLRQDGQIQVIEFAIDINFSNEINFICFLEPSLSQPMMLILNNEQRITGFSKSLIQQINSTEDILLKQDIYGILPAFDHNLACQENIEAIFSGDPRQSYSSMTNNYITTVVTKYRILDDQIVYYFVYFEFLRRKQQLSISGHRTDLGISIQPKEDDSQDGFSAEESVKIEIPYDSKIDIDISNQQILPQVDKENSQAIMIKNYEQEQTAQIFSPKQQTFINKPQIYYSRRNKGKISADDSEEESNNNNNRRKDVDAIFEENALNDAASQVSSLLGVRKSRFYKKYEILINLHELEKNSSNHKILVILFVFTFLIQIILASVQLGQINNNLINLVSDIDLLQIKNLVYQPLESFLVTRWTITDYNNLRDSGSITLSEYNFLIPYPKSNLALGYDSLFSNIVSVLNRQELQPLLKNSYLLVELYITTGKGEIYNMTLRNCIDILLNYQFQFKMAYVIDGKAEPDSPYVYYSYRNYKIFKNLFSLLNEQVLEQTISRCNVMNYQSTIVFIIQISLLIVMILWLYIRLRKIYDRYGKYFEILLQTDHSSLEQEIIYLKSQLEKIQKYQDYLFKYNFYLEKHEQNLSQYNQANNDDFRKRQRNEQSISINSYLWNAFFIILFIISGENCFLTYYQTYTYFDKYPATARFYKQVSDVGTDVPTMFAQREVLYNRFYFTYFNSTDFAGILDEVIEAVNRTRIFTNQDQNFNDLLLSTSFRDYYSYLQNHNLCPELPEYIKEKSQAVCQITLNSNMNRGLKLVLINIVNLIQTDMEINKFQSRDKPAYLELEGAFLVSELIKNVNKIFNEDLNNQTVQLLNQITTYNIIVLTFIGIIIIYGFTIFKESLTSKFYLVQRIIYLVPRKTLFFDDAFERNIRNLFVNDLKN